MDNFKFPKVEVISFGSEDIICTSPTGGLTINDGTGNSDNPIIWPGKK